MAKLPYMQFYPADYQADVRRLTMATQGAWMQIICVLWRAPKRGRLTLSLEEWGRELGCPASEFSLYLEELVHHNVGKISRECIENVEQITISSKRIMREKMKQSLALKRKQKQRDKSMSRTCHASVTYLSHQCHAEESESESESELREEKKEEKSASRVSVKRSPPPSDEEWLRSLESQEAYKNLPVRIELGKCQTWCDTNHKLFSRRRFVNWLNRIEQPMQATGASILPMVRPAPIPPFPGPEDPIGRSLWRKSYDNPANPFRVERR